MSDTLKPGKSDLEVTPKKEDPFELPRSIAQQLRKCMESRTRVKAREAVKYLWINLATREQGEADTPRLSVDDWLNVVDEAASVGVTFFVVCLGDDPNRYPDIWPICQWAQDTHGIKVGLHVAVKDLKVSDLQDVRGLDPEKTWLFFQGENAAAKKALEKAGYSVNDASVRHSEPAGGCEGPQNLLCIGAEGIAYCCGVVLGKKDFKLGHVMEQPITTLLNEHGEKRHVPKGFVRPEGGCDGCPNQMIDRMRK